MLKSSGDFIELDPDPYYPQICGPGYNQSGYTGKKGRGMEKKERNNFKLKKAEYKKKFG